MNLSSLTKQLDELQLIRCSLLPDEALNFLDEHDIWMDLVAAHENMSTFSTLRQPTSPARIQVKVNSANVSFVVEIPRNYSGSLAEALPTFTAKGDELTRADQERWQHILERSLQEIDNAEYPIYQLLSSHLLPLVHEELESCQAQHPNDLIDAKLTSLSPQYHALFTSHHLISANKRRSLQSWSNSLSISGFAKVGYPGVIYAQGQKENVEEFVGNVKAMQWLALKVRFIEELPTSGTANEQELRWIEFQKVGEVVEEMRRLGREQFIIEMGIGSTGNK